MNNFEVLKQKHLFETTSTSCGTKVFIVKNENLLDFLYDLKNLPELNFVFLISLTANDNIKENLFEIKEKRHLNNVVVLKNSFDDLGKDIDTVSVPSALSDFQPLLNTIRLQQLTEAFTKELNINPDNGGGVLTKYRSNLTMSNKH